MNTIPIRTGYLPPPADELAHVRDYQDGWNDAQADRPFSLGRSVYYTTGYADAGGRVPGPRVVQ